MNDFFVPVGPQMKLMGQSVARPLSANLLRSVCGLLYLLLVPLLYVAIFRARKKHAMAVGESASTLTGFPIKHQESLRERE